MKHLLHTVGALIIGFSVIVTPLQSAQAAAYVVDLSQFSTPQEKISHLRGVLALLQAQLASLQSSGLGGNSGGNSTVQRNTLSVTTLQAQDVRDNKAELRGRFEMDDEDYVLAWFEYGETRELYERTVMTRIEGGQDESRIHTHNAENLKDDTTYYYRLVVESERGNRSYGSVRSVRTVDENRAFIARAKDTEVEIGEIIVVEWLLPTKAINGQNWIGIFEVDSPHSVSAAWSRANTETGTVSLRATKEGEYEGRLFTNDSYTLVAVSELITVTD